MHWLIKHTNNKQGICYAMECIHSDMHALHNPATLFNNHPYISSSGTPAVDAKFTASRYMW